MNEIRLTDFTYDELQSLLAAIIRVEVYDGKMWNSAHNMDHLNTWKIQVISAASYVKRKENINSN